jgi:hypothetical protein
MNDPMNNAGRTPCPAWCTTHHRHHGHMKDTSFGRVAVTLYQLRDRPVDLHIWDQTETPYPHVRLDRADALTLARILSALDPSDIIRFAAALAEDAQVLHDQDDAKVSS